MFVLYAESLCILSSFSILMVVDSREIDSSDRMELRIDSPGWMDGGSSDTPFGEFLLGGSTFVL